MQSESTSSSFTDTIPVLFKRPINQKFQCRPEDFHFDINFDKIISQTKLKKDPHQVIVKTLHVKKTQLLVSYQKIPLKRIMHILGPKSQQNFLFLNFDIYKTLKQYAKELLNSQIVINKEKYNFFGYSKLSLKNFSCFFYKGSQGEISKIFDDLGNFNQIYQISKKAARLSLLYTDARIAMKLEDKQIKVVDDVERDDVCFSDGCGYVSLDLARKIKRYLTTEQKEQMDYLPAVYQVRIKGIKGIVLINPALQGEQLIARRSMEKFKAKPDKLNELIIISHSKPAYYASINQQIIMLLDGLGLVDPDYLMKLQENYLQLLKKAIESPMNHIELLMYLGEDEKIQQLLKNQSNEKKKESMVRSIVSEQIFRNIRSKDMKNRLKIPLSNARFLYGAVYPQLFNNTNKQTQLNKHQVFLRVTTSKGVVQTIIGKVIVTKNPCYYCGDVRILQAVDIPQHQIPFAKKLVDVIIFSTEGQMPVGSTMAGSDYDGDQYFVCWDQNLIPERSVKPYHYPASKPRKQKQPVSQHQLIDYLIYFDRFIVSRINARYLQFATHSRDGAHCPQCIELGTELFSRAIDSANTGERVKMPEHLNCFVYQQSMDGQHVWVQMAKEYQLFLDQQFSLDSGLTQGWKVKYKQMEEFVRNYAQSKHYSEYQLFKIIKSWYMSTKCTKYDLFQHVDFTQLQTKQKRQTKDLPNFPEKYFGNPFDHSTIFSHQLFQRKGIQFHTYQQAPKKWRHYHSAAGDQIDYSILSEALTVFNNVLFGIRVMKDVYFVFSITQMKKKCYTQNYFPNESFKAYYLGFGQLETFNETQLEQKQYKLFYDDDILQIYQKQKGNSFIKIWFQSEIVSIDLARFDRSLLRRHKVNKEQIESLQIYVGLSENYKKVQTKKLYVTEPKKNNEDFKKNRKEVPSRKNERNYEKNHFNKNNSSSRYYYDQKEYHEDSRRQQKGSKTFKHEQNKAFGSDQKPVKKTQWVEKKSQPKQDDQQKKQQPALEKVLSDFIDKY